MGMSGNLAKYGGGLGFLYNAFAAGNGEGGLSIDSLQKWAKRLGWDAKWLESGFFQNIIKGREGPLSLLAGSLAILPGKAKNWGVLAAVIWMGGLLYQEYQRDGLKNEWDSVTSAISNPKAALGLDGEKQDPAEIAKEISALDDALATYKAKKAAGAFGAAGDDITQGGQGDDLLLNEVAAAPAIFNTTAHNAQSVINNAIAVTDTETLLKRAAVAAKDMTTDPRAVAQIDGQDVAFNEDGAYVAERADDLGLAPEELVLENE
ncbi:MAG: hypothetical protein ACRBCT_04645 [Alphaproteobacteria bacterium]